MEDPRRVGQERVARHTPMTGGPASHRASARVLDQCGFLLEETRRSHAEFPNLRPGGLEDVLCYARLLEAFLTPPEAKC
jgi:hypothetical protein